MRTIKVEIPAYAYGRLICNGITENETSRLERLLILNYKVGSLNEHFMKQHKLQSKVQEEEFKVNLAETMCHCLSIMIAEQWDVEKMISLGWEKISDRWKDFKKSGMWIDRTLDERI